MHYHKCVVVFCSNDPMVFTRDYVESKKREVMCVFIAAGGRQQHHHYRIFSSKFIMLNYFELLHNGIITVATTLLPINHSKTTSVHISFSVFTQIHCVHFQFKFTCFFHVSVRVVHIVCTFLSVCVRV